MRRANSCNEGHYGSDGDQGSIVCRHYRWPQAVLNPCKSIPRQDCWLETTRLQLVSQQSNMAILTTKNLKEPLVSICIRSVHETLMVALHVAFY